MSVSEILYELGLGYILHDGMIRESEIVTHSRGYIVNGGVYMGSELSLFKLSNREDLCVGIFW